MTLYERAASKFKKRSDVAQSMELLSTKQMSVIDRHMKCPTTDYDRMKMPHIEDTTITTEMT